MINDRRSHHREESDLLSMLMNARDADTGEGMSNKQIRDEIMTIFLAGHETTATTLSWAWHLLAQHPDVRTKLDEELTSVLGTRTPTVEDLPNLVYSRMVIDESLRMFPPAWMFARVAVADDDFGDFTLPAGAMLLVSPYVTHHLPSLWPDPEQFNPERFRPGALTSRHKYAYLPFSGGPRVCIGNSFALMEATLILAMVAQQYHPTTAPGHTVRPQTRATLRPFPGVWMTL
jgi:cytochrome P450